MDPEVKPDEHVARFIFNRTEFVPSRMEAKPGAFLPRNGTTSVYRTKGLEEDAIWDLGREVGKHRDRSPKGRADILADAVRQAGLRLDPNNVPPRHANIVGWPDQKQAQLLSAQKLAIAARFSKCPQD